MTPEIVIDVTAIRSTAPPPWPGGPLRPEKKSLPIVPGQPPRSVVGAAPAPGTPPGGSPPLPPAVAKLPPAPPPVEADESVLPHGATSAPAPRTLPERWLATSMLPDMAMLDVDTSTSGREPTPY